VTEAAQPPKVKPFAAAETAVRRLLLMIGFGFGSFVAGGIFGAALSGRLAARLQGGSEAVLMVVWFLIANAWVLLFLPVIAYLAARFLDVKPWPTGIIGASTGLLFQVALLYVSSGAEGLMDARQVASFAGAAIGAVLTALAVKRGRELARVAEEHAKVAAEKKKTQYDEFVKQAEALADRREQVPIAPAQAPAAEAPAAPTEPPKP
jgi:hypothetical protein